QIGTSNTTSFSDTNLSSNTTYRYRVRAVDAAGNLSSYSSIVSATTQGVSSGVQTLIYEDFSTYTSTQHMLSDPRGIYATRLWGDVGAEYISLDTTTGYGGLSRSMRYT